VTLYFKVTLKYINLKYKKYNMKKILPILLILFLLPINAGAVDITVSPASGTTQVEKSFTYQITVTNDRRIPDDFILTVFGRHLEWADLQSYYFQMEPYESREISLNFYPKEEGKYEYEVQVSSIRNPRNMDSLTLDLKVNPLIDPDITDFSVDVIGDDLKVDLTVTSKKTRDIEIDFEITDSKDNRVKVLSVTRSVTGEREISESIPLEDMLAGSYSIKVSLVGTDVSRTANFYIQAVHNVVTTKKTVSNPLTQEVTITITNQGNTADNYNIEENLPAGQYVTLIDSPSSQYLQEDEMVYQWSLTGMQVGQTIEIKYTVDYWKNILGWVIMGLAIIGLLGLGVVRAGRPNISKTYMRRRDGHVIVLEIRGSLSKNLRNVLVKDRVSPLGKVLPEFEGPKPIVRESESGTELIWRLGDIRPRSEIYLTYKIRPLIEAQLKMPRAYLTYRKGDEGKITVFSKQLMLE
jgi:hypothetical protein